MRRMLVLMLAWLPTLALALNPYVAGDKVDGGDLRAAMSQVEQKLAGAGFQVVGRHTPTGLPEHGSVVVTDKAMLDALAGIGGTAIVGAGIRIGVKVDGTVSWMNPEYWYRAYLRADYAKAEPAVKALHERLAKALGNGKPFGGKVDTDDLPDYRYMIGMEKFDSDKNELKTYASFDEALATLRANLAKGAGNTAKVYEIVLPEKKLAVFGVAMNDPKRGEGWWAKKIGPEHIAALPWEVYVVGNKAGALFGRYRTALAWPDLGMGTFMTIGDHPDTARAFLGAAAGAQLAQ